MLHPFYTAALVFHGGLVLVTVLLLVRWRRRVKAPPSVGRWVGWLVADAGWFGIALVMLASAAALMTHAPAWAWMRLTCQGLFGEGVALAAGAAVIQAARGWRGGAAVTAFLAAALLAVYCEAYHHGPNNLQVRRHTLSLARERPPAGTLRILHLTDLQTDRIGAYERRAVRAAAAQRADLIVFTGDYLQKRVEPTDPALPAHLHRLLRDTGLAAPLGFFAVGGDVDGPGWQTLFTGLPVRCLEDSHAKVALPGGRSLAITGLALRTSRTRDAAKLARVLAAAPDADFHLVIGHSPDFVTELPPRKRVDLALAGHTHGGQVALPFFGPPFTLSRLPRRYAGGLNDYRGTPLHVSRGIGRERGLAPQIRFLCPPEICLLDVTY